MISDSILAIQIFLQKIDELDQLYASGRGCLEPVFPGISQALVWSASANIDYATDAWAFDFAAGNSVIYPRDSRLQLLMVSNPR